MLMKDWVTVVLDSQKVELFDKSHFDLPAPSLLQFVRDDIGATWRRDLILVGSEDPTRLHQNLVCLAVGHTPATCSNSH